MKLDLPEQKKRVFSMTIPIRWGDMDAMAHSDICEVECYFNILDKKHGASGSFFFE